MSAAHSALPAHLDTASIVDGCDLAFDPGDQANGSLYLGTPRGSGPPLALIERLRGAGLWSAEPCKVVADEQRAAYKDGLAFVAAAVFADHAGEVLLARFDHPRFPSDAGRWQAWLDAAARTHERVR